MAIDDIRTPTLAQIVSKALKSALGETYVSGPATIQDYDSTTQTASVQPNLQVTVTDEDGNVTVKSRAIINHVPILFPGGGGFRIMWPLNPGDTVLLVMSDQSLDIWKSAGGVVDPLDSRLHSINDAVAIPGLHPDSDAWTVGDASVITIGADGAEGDFVATANRVLTELQSMASIFNAHTHVLTLTVGTGTAAPPVSGMSPNAPASATVKVLG